MTSPLTDAADRLEARAADRDNYEYGSAVEDRATGDLLRAVDAAHQRSDISIGGETHSSCLCMWSAWPCGSDEFASALTLAQTVMGET